VAVIKIRLNALLGLPTAAPVDYQGNFDDLALELPWTLEQCLERATQQRLDLTVRRKALAIAEKEAEIVTGQFYPRVELQGSYIDLDKDYTQQVGLGAVDRDYDTKYWTAGINVEWRFFEGGRQYYGLQRARSEIARVREELREVSDLVASQVHTYFLMTSEARQRIAVAESALGEATEGEARAQVRFEARVGTVTELLDAQSRLTQARSNHLQAQADYQQAVAQLLYAMSERNPALHF
jgi:outer membrane protein TolC